jgi:FlaA1/EpsC-like NDP-sugar epimerase
MTEPTAPQWLLRLAGRASQIRSDRVLVAIDAALLLAAYGAATLLRFEGAVPAEFAVGVLWFAPLAAVAHLVALAAAGAYGAMWRHASMVEARRLLLADGAVIAVLAAAVFAGPRVVPLSVVLLGGLLATALSAVVRFHARLFAFNRHGRDSARMVVLGAGGSGAAVIRELQRGRDTDPAPVAVLDDDPVTHGRRVAGVPVAGSLSDLERTVERCRAEQVLLAISNASRSLVRSVAERADDAGVTLKVLPDVGELVQGAAGVRDIRDVAIEDLLGREAVDTDLDAVAALVAGRRVLVVGAGGSIGAEVLRQVAGFRPAELTALDHDETHLHEALAALDRPADAVLADIRDSEAIDGVFDRVRPEVVFHAAAHKQVPLLEAHPCEAVRTNVLGTAAVLEAAKRAGTPRLVFISTDKAVQPSSVMGASKKVGEQMVLAERPADAAWCAVRFGNVLGSRGSVVPTFISQIRRGGPVTVTHPGMSRYFMTIPESVQLVLQAAALSDGGEVFMLDMGEPVRILDLAERMIRLSGKRVGTDIPVRITGARAGEKLCEELAEPEERPEATSHPAVSAIRPAALPREALSRAVQALRVASFERDDDRVRRTLMAVVRRRPTGPVEIRLDDEEVTAVWSRSRT